MALIPVKSYGFDDRRSVRPRGNRRGISLLTPAVGFGRLTSGLESSNRETPKRTVANQLAAR
jgi:hypothetical protein